ncbi:hypothetical protein [Paenibacillus sp. BJ-4]|uniref:hypothetical protein n=1 Tax=Paenibacillus sp. BJ-4 TaxID=2878097 RepID=UPI001CEFC0E6|nr:hypothetical protein [Paenibacillus sp. BJ-4]
METSKCKGRVGKLSVRIAVADDNNEKELFTHSKVRYWSQVISCFTKSIGYIMAALTAKKPNALGKSARSVVLNHSTIPEVTVPAPAPGVNRLSVPLNKEE